MAKQARGGLGRGLGSLMGSTYKDSNVSGSRTNETVPKNQKASAPSQQQETSTSQNQKASSDVKKEYQRTQTSERERIVYDARGANADTIAESLSPDTTGRFDAVNLNNIKSSSEKVSTNTIGSPASSINKSPDQNVSRETSTHTQAVNNPRVNTIERRVEDNLINATNMIIEMDIDAVSPNPDQPRTNFDPDDLKELSNSIKREGVIQPILVRKVSDNEYQIIAGERRWQASKLAGLDTVPIQIKDVDDEKALELALIENIQRTDLNPIEEAYGYKRLMERNKMTQADIAQAVSKGRSTIANALRLLELPEEAQQLLFENKISAGHARAILSVPDKEDRMKLTGKLENNKMSVRDTENLARLMANKPSERIKKEPTPAIYKSVARELKNVLSTNVKIKSSKGKNKIEIEFADEKDLERLFGLIVPE